MTVYILLLFWTKAQWCLDPLAYISLTTWSADEFSVGRSPLTFSTICWWQRDCWIQPSAFSSGISLSQSAYPTNKRGLIFYFFYTCIWMCPLLFPTFLCSIWVRFLSFLGGKIYKVVTMEVFPFLFCLRFLGGEVGGAVLDVVGARSLSWRGRRQGHLEEDKEEAIMGVQKEDVEKFLNGNPDFAKKYFAKKMNTSTISKVSGLPEKQIDFSQFQELSQVSYSFIFCLLLILFLDF